MIIYQCLRCGLTFKSKRQVIVHLRNTEKVDPFTVEYYYQSFSVKEEVNGVV
jgi:hypothetical protein